MSDTIDLDIQNLSQLRWLEQEWSIYIKQKEKALISQKLAENWEAAFWNKQKIIVVESDLCLIKYELLLKQKELTRWERIFMSKKRRAKRAKIFEETEKLIRAQEEKIIEEKNELKRLYRNPKYALTYEGTLVEDAKRRMDIHNQNIIQYKNEEYEIRDALYQLSKLSRFFKAFLRKSSKFLRNAFVNPFKLVQKTYETGSDSSERLTANEIIKQYRKRASKNTGAYQYIYNKTIEKIIEEVTQAKGKDKHTLLQAMALPLGNCFTPFERHIKQKAIGIAQEKNSPFNLQDIDKLITAEATEKMAMQAVADSGFANNVEAAEIVAGLVNLCHLNLGPSLDALLGKEKAKKVRDLRNKIGIAIPQEGNITYLPSPTEHIEFAFAMLVGEERKDIIIAFAEVCCQKNDNGQLKKNSETRKYIIDHNKLQAFKEKQCRELGILEVAKERVIDKFEKDFIEILQQEKYKILSEMVLDHPDIADCIDPNKQKNELRIKMKSEEGEKSYTDISNSFLNEKIRKFDSILSKNKKDFDDEYSHACKTTLSKRKFKINIATNKINAHKAGLQEEASKLGLLSNQPKALIIPKEEEVKLTDFYRNEKRKSSLLHSFRKSFK